MNVREAEAFLEQRRNQVKQEAEWAGLQWKGKSIGYQLKGKYATGSALPQYMRVNPNFNHNVSGLSPVYQYLVSPEYRYGSVDIAPQEQRPETPESRKVSVSTYGITIPLSMGARRINGNIIEATKIKPVLEGTYEYDVTYQIPIYEVGPE